MDIKIDQTTQKFVLKDGDLVLTTGVEAIAQFVAQRVKTFLGEWFLDTTEGIPYFEKAFKKNPNIIEVEAMIKDVIMKTPGIIELTAFSFDFNSPTRVGTLTFSARSEQGDVIFSQDIGA